MYKHQLKTQVHSVVIAIFCFALVANAQLPTVFTYQGDLVLNGQPATGTFDFEFRVFTVLTGGNPVGGLQTKLGVTVTNGHFATDLDFGTVFNTGFRYLEISVRQSGQQAYTTLSPRKIFTYSPLATWANRSDLATVALTAEDATNLGGRPESFYRNASNLTAGTIAVGRLPVPLSLLGGVAGGPVLVATNSGNNNGSSGVMGQSTATVGVTYGGNFTTASTSGRGVQGVASATSGTNYGGFFQSDSTSGRGVSGFASSQSGTTYGVVGESLSTSGRGVTGLALSGTGTTFGGYFQTFSQSGRAVYGIASNNAGNTNYGGYFESASFNGKGVFGETTSTGDGFGIGGLFYSRNNNGKGVEAWAHATTGTNYGGYFVNKGTAGAAVYGRSDSTTGTSYGGEFINAGASGFGVYGRSTGTTGNTYGGYFTAVSSTGTGVRGNGDRGVFGRGRIGVYGENNGTSGYGVWSQGAFGATGTKAFRIDHPMDPENKYLSHYSIESPEVLNSYTGKIVLDENGEAIVTMPRYFASINKDPRYSLTPLGAAMPMLHVSEEIDETTLSRGAEAKPGEDVPTVSFRIAGGVPGARVSWEVKSVRNDPWMRQGDSPVESDKIGDEKGKYLHPELFGQPKERGIFYQAEQPDGQLPARTKPGEQP